MSRRHEDLFPELTPPIGGTTRLIARIDEDERRRSRHSRGLGWGAAVATSVVAVMLGVRMSPPPVDDAWRELPGLLALGLGRPMSEAVEVAGESRGHADLLRVRVDDPEVVFYLVGSTEGRALAQRADGER
jgi:hypothetical protein